MKKRDLEKSNNLFEGLMMYFIHQDQLIWNIFFTIIAIQSGILFSSYTLRKSWLSIVILSFGIIFTIIILLLARKAEKDRDVSVLLISDLVNNLIPKNIRKRYLDFGNRKKPWFLFSSSKFFFLRGKFLFRITLFILIFIDLTFMAFIIWFEYCLP